MSDQEFVKEMCSADYGVTQCGGTVTITGTGEHNTGGFRTYFEKSKIDVFPPEFTLYHDRPTGPVPDVITPFTVDVSFESKQPVKSVTVHDVGGRHELPVEQS